MLLSRVGEGEHSGLICKTDKVDCCGTVPNRHGQFYYPNGLQVPIRSVSARAGHGFYRDRGAQEIRLNRREEGIPPTGKYHCEIPDASGEIKTLYITLVRA